MGRDENAYYDGKIRAISASRKNSTVAVAYRMPALSRGGPRHKFAAARHNDGDNLARAR
jgi:hypothetical protein